MSYEKFIKAIEKGDIQTVEKLLPQVDPSANNNLAIQKACGYSGTRGAAEHFHILIVKWLLADPRVNPSDNDNEAIQIAIRQDNKKVVELLLANSRIDLSSDGNWIIKWASEKGYLGIVKMLLADPRVNPSVNDNLAIILASKNGHLKVVELLLADPRVDPSDNDNSAIEWADQNGQCAIVHLLSHDPRVDTTKITKKCREKILKMDASRATDIAMTFRGSGLPPYVVADIIDWDRNRSTFGPSISAFDVNAIVQHVIPIIQGPSNTVARRSYPLVQKGNKSKYMKAGYDTMDDTET